MNWTSLGTISQIPTRPQGWASFPIKWLDFAGQQSIFRIDIGNVTDINSLSAAGLKFFLVRKASISGIKSTAKVIYPNAVKTSFNFDFETEEQYSLEVCKVLRRRQLIEEPSYNLIAYGSYSNF